MDALGEGGRAWGGGGGGRERAPAPRLKGAMAKVAAVRMMSSRMSLLREESSSMLMYLRWAGRACVFDGEGGREGA